MLSFGILYLKNFITWRIPLEEGIRGEREGDFTESFYISKLDNLKILRTNG
jgi:hypothetical protein